MPNIKIAAIAAPPPPNRHRFCPAGRARPLTELAVVFTSNSLVALPPAVIVTFAGFKLQTGRSCAPNGDAARVQVMFMVPEYVLLAENVMTPVALDPGLTADGEAAVITTCETVTLTVPVVPIYVASPA